MNATEITLLWDFLSQVWGNKFLEEYGRRPNDAWTAALADVSIDAARHAVKGLIKEGEPFAPTLPQFLAYCRRYRPRPEPIPLLEEQEPSPEAKERARANLDQLRRDLGLPARGPLSHL